MAPYVLSLIVPSLWCGGWGGKGWGVPLYLDEILDGLCSSYLSSDGTIFNCHSKGCLTVDLFFFVFEHIYVPCYPDMPKAKRRKKASLEVVSDWLVFYTLPVVYPSIFIECIAIQHAHWECFCLDIIPECSRDVALEKEMCDVLFGMSINTAGRG